MDTKFLKSLVNIHYWIVTVPKAGTSAGMEAAQSRLRLPGNLSITY
jgi:hypothetical protein